MTFNCILVTFPCEVLGQVWYLIVSIFDLCLLTNFATLKYETKLQKYIRTGITILTLSFGK